MKRLTLDDLLEPEAYEAVRAELRDAIIAHKRVRRVAVGERVSLVFEDRETLRWQVLEMARVERIRDPKTLQLELDVYNELVPDDNELSATLFLEIPDLATIKHELDRLVGLDEHLSLVLGEGPEATPIQAHFDPKQMEADRISAVQYIRFPLTKHHQQQLADPNTPAWLRIDHPNYGAATRLTPNTQKSLATDLQGGCPPLIDFEV